MEFRWRLKAQNLELAANLSKELGIPVAMAQVLVNRGLGDPETSRTFLEPSLNKLADPFSLPDLDRATERLAQAVINQEQVGIFGDYDADGVTSTALMVLGLRSFGLKASWFIPSRLTDGYGLNQRGLDKFIDQGVKLIVTVDCGASDHEQLAAAVQSGLEVLITDHHKLGPDWPEAEAFVNPQRPDGPDHFKCLAGVGVAFYLIVGLRGKLRQKGWFNGGPEPNLKQLLDLTAIGTLADVCPVIGQNRILTAHGLEVLSQTARPGLRALFDKARVDGQATSRDVLFGLAPRINAAGRLGQAEKALELLLCEDEREATRLADHLEQLNRERQEVEQTVLAEALEQLEQRGDPRQRLALVAVGEGWHPGVLGIVASRLVRRYYRPAFALTIDGDTATGSGRSIESFPLHHGLTAVSEHLIRYGGHAQAAGLTLAADKVSPFALALENEVGRVVPPDQFTPPLDVDAVLDLDDIDDFLVDCLQRLAPFGPGNPEPLFTAANVGLLSASTMGRDGSHLRLKVRQDRRTFSAIAFGQGKLFGRLPSLARIAFQVNRNTFRGRNSLEITIKSIVPN